MDEIHVREVRFTKSEVLYSTISIKYQYIILYFNYNCLLKLFTFVLINNGMTPRIAQSFLKSHNAL